jgi:DNA uptake protein ComE-like DNA-binding protein
MAMKIYRFVQNEGYLNSVSDLHKVPGIGVRKLEELGKELEIP